MEIESRRASLNLRRAKLGAFGGLDPPIIKMAMVTPAAGVRASWRAWALELHRAAWGGFPLYLGQPNPANRPRRCTGPCEDGRSGRASAVSGNQARGDRRRET